MIQSPILPFRKRWNSLLCLSVLAGGLLLFGGCAESEPNPDTEIAHSATMVNQAENAGAQHYAAFDFENAQSKLKEAQKLAMDGEFKKARFLAEEAGVDAELAMAKTETVKAKESEEELKKSIELLQKEMAPAP